MLKLLTCIIFASFTMLALTILYMLTTA